MKTYYFINDGINPECVYGQEEPVCIDAATVEWLNTEWGVNLFDNMHEASAEEIEEYGVYDYDS